MSKTTERILTAMAVMIILFVLVLAIPEKKSAPVTAAPIITSIFIQEGVASWYGKPFHGRKAADGSIYNMHEYTAASRWIAMGVRVKVVNVQNGKSVIVKITDRGPYINNRAIDLSKQAASDLGMLKQGLTVVKIYAIK